MADSKEFFGLGTKTDSIDVQLSYKIVRLFSEGLYSSPNKAIEELVANSFDAGATRVHVLLSSNLHEQDASITIIDDGHGMDADGLRQHWLIGLSNKRRLEVLPRKRQQIGQFGIGKLATYVLADRLTHITKVDGRYYSTSMDYTNIDTRVNKEVEPKSPIKIDLRELTEDEAKKATEKWVETGRLKKNGMPLFGSRSPGSWTVAVMSSLKPKVHEIRPGVLKWVLRTALPLRPDFQVFLNGSVLESSKQGKGVLQTWVLGRELVEVPKPAPDDIQPSEDESEEEGKRYALDVPSLGRVWGYAEAYKDLLTTGKSEAVGRSHGFFVYVFGRLINVNDGHFGISPNELRHGTFGRFRLVIHVDALDQVLRSNRETVEEGPLLDDVQNLLRGIFNAVRTAINRHDLAEEPGAKLARKLASGPASLTRRPIVQLARAVLNNGVSSKYLVIPEFESVEEREGFLNEIDERVKGGENFVTGLTIDTDGSAEDGLARFELRSGVLKVNAWHPLVSTFYDQFVGKKTSQPLELFAMAEVLSESHLFELGLEQQQIDDYLALRDGLLRAMANESGQKSAFAVSAELKDARNNENALEEMVCQAFKSLGFESTPIGKSGNPDGIAKAFLSPDDQGASRSYQVSLEAKSKKKDGHKVAASTVNVSAIARNRDKHGCDHALVVGPDFPTTKEDSALEVEIASDRESSKASGKEKTITLIRIDDLAKLVVLRPMKHVGLKKLRELFDTCRLPEESARWVKTIEDSEVSKPPYRKIIEAIAKHQREYDEEPPKFAALRMELRNVGEDFRKDQEIKDICLGMERMAPQAISVSGDRVELDQSVENVIAAIDGAIEEYNQNV